MQHSLKTLGYSVKKLRKAAAQHDELTRQQRKADILSCFTADQLVFVDESSKIDRTSERRYGRAVAGERACEIQSFKRGVWYGILPALCINGLLSCTGLGGVHDWVITEVVSLLSSTISTLVRWTLSLDVRK